MPAMFSPGDTCVTVIIFLPSYPTPSPRTAPVSAFPSQASVSRRLKRRCGAQKSHSTGVTAKYLHPLGLRARFRLVSGGFLPPVHNSLIFNDLQLKMSRQRTYGVRMPRRGMSGKAVSTYRLIQGYQFGWIEVAGICN
jgi:hypothetical protein